MYSKIEKKGYYSLKVDRNVYDLIKAENEAIKTARDTVKQSNGSCKTCSEFIQGKLFSRCSLKAKQIKPYNYCEAWKQKESNHDNI